MGTQNKNIKTYSAWDVVHLLLPMRHGQYIFNKTTRSKPAI